MIVIGAPVKDRSWVIPQWLKGISEQDEELITVCIVSPSEDGTRELLLQNGVVVIDDKEEGRPTSEIDQHRWGDIECFEYMARLRNLLVDFSLELGADYFFSLDTDIVLPPNGLKRLIQCIRRYPGVVAPAVNMSQNGKPTWNVMHWVDRSYPIMVNRHVNPPAGQSDIVMAAMLLDQQGLQARWEAHESGEDIGFAVDCLRKGIKQWWLPEVRCEHLMRKTVFN